MKTKELTPDQRVTNAAWLREQITKLARDAESAAKDVRAGREADLHYAKELRRILSGLTWDEDFRQRASAAWSRASGKVARKAKTR
jgi:hypothetical protein